MVVQTQAPTKQTPTLEGPHKRACHSPPFQKCQHLHWHFFKIFLSIFLSTTFLVGLTTSGSKEPIHTMFLCSQHMRFYRMYFMFSCAHLMFSSNPFHSTIFIFILEFTSNFNLKISTTTLDKGYRCANKWLLDRALQSKSLLPQHDMILKFMHKKSNFSTHGCAILFACTTTPISSNLKMLLGGNYGLDFQLAF